MSTSDSNNETSGNCFSGLLRRLLCTGSLQTHPSDSYLSELDKIDFNQPKKARKIESSNESTQTAATPGVVARLMGLESMPDLNWVPKQRTNFDSTMRSRSVSSVDYLAQFDFTRQSLHRRVKTSVSFREVPPYFNQKNHDFIVLCLDKDDDIRSNGEVGIREVKEKKAERRKNDKNVRGRNLVNKRENQESSKKSCGRKENSRRVENVTIHKKDDYRKPNGNLKGKSPLKPLSHKEVCDQMKFKKQRKKAESSKCKSVNSVASTSGAKELISRKKSPMKHERFKKPCSNFVHKGKADNQELKAINKKVDKQLITDLENDFYSKVSVCVFRLTEEDTNGSNWPYFSRKVFKFEDFEEMCAKFGEEIFQILLEQIVNELVHEEI